MFFDPLIRAAVLPVSWWIFLSGVDDLFIDLCYAGIQLLRRDSWKLSLDRLNKIPERKIALFVPCWHEDEVIEGMVEHNIAAIDYRSYDIFLGVYPNDPRTLERAAALEERYPQVHRSICPWDGPTNKADCLNWIYQRMKQEEETTSLRYQVIVQHDAEDLVHPKSFKLINRFIHRYDMVQVPVFPLEMPLKHFTHGTYCDEFAEFQVKDLFIRQALGGFLPSTGVGTAFRREALEEMAGRFHNQIFNVSTLTEDYEIGLKLKLQGKRQLLVRKSLPVNGNGRKNGNGNGHKNGNGNGQRNGHTNGKTNGNGNGKRTAFVATREYFPDDFRGAVRQKSRWVMGVSLQTWAQHGWQVPWKQVYWFWRDRKGLLGNLVTMAANLIFLYCLAMDWVSALLGTRWSLSEVFPESRVFWWLVGFNTFFLFERLAFRLYTVARVYGGAQALGSILRIPWANCINFASTISALRTFALSRLRKRDLAWAKTGHAFPNREQLTEYKRRLGDLLLEHRWVTPAQLQSALDEQEHTGERLGQILVQHRHLAEADLLSALGRQQNLEVREVDPFAIELAALRLLPWDLAREHRVVPLSLLNGDQILVASPDLLSEEICAALETATGRKVIAVLTGNTDFQYTLDRAYARLVFDPSGKVRLGGALFAAGHLTGAQLEQAFREQKRTRRPLGEIVLDKGWVNEEQVREGMRASGHDFRRISGIDVDASVASLIPALLQRQMLVIPLERKNGILRVATAQPRSDPDRYMLESMAGCGIDWVQVPPSDIRAVLDGQSGAAAA